MRSYRRGDLVECVLYSRGHEDGQKLAGYLSISNLTGRLNVFVEDVVEGIVGIFNE